MVKILDKRAGEGFARGELGAAVNYDPDDRFGGVKPKKMCASEGFIGRNVERLTATTRTTAAHATLGVAEILGGITIDTPTAGKNLTTPTAALLIAGMDDPKVGDSFLYVIKNAAGATYAVTLVGGDNVTLKGTAAVAHTKVGVFLFIVTDMGATKKMDCVVLAIP